MRAFISAFCLLLLVSANFAFAKVYKARVVAIYKNHNVTEDQLAKHYELLAQDAPNMPSKPFSELPKDLQSFILNEYVKNLAIEDEALEKKIDKSPEYKSRLEQYSKLLLRETFLNEMIKNRVTDEVIRAEYENMVKKIRENGEVRFQCLVFVTKEQAEKAAAQIRAGKSFAEVAKTIPKDQKSLDATKYFYFGELSPEIEDAVFSVGLLQVSAPVATSSGWYLIKVLDKRPVRQVPSFSQACSQIKQKLYLEHRSKIVEALMQRANIKVKLDQPDRP